MDEDSALARGVEKYAENYKFRAAVTAIPYIGGSLDMLVAGRYSEIQARRLDSFLEDLQDRMEHIEAVAVDLEDEAFADIIVTSIEGAVRTRSEHKRTRFAAILANQVERGDSWEEPEAALRLLTELDDIHIAVLEVALEPLGPGVHRSPRVVDVVRTSEAANTGATIHLPDRLPHYSDEALRLACSELASRGLLVDFNADKWGGGVMTSFATTNLAAWFADWLGTSSRSA